MPTIIPISRLTPEVCDGEYDNLTVPDDVDNREGKLLRKHAASAVLLWRPSKRQRYRQRNSGLNGLSESFSEANFNSFVICNFIQELKPSLAVKPSIYH